MQSKTEKLVPTHLLIYMVSHIRRPKHLSSRLWWHQISHKMKTVYASIYTNVMYYSILYAVRYWTTFLAVLADCKHVNVRLQSIHTSRFFISLARSITYLVPRTLTMTACLSGISNRIVAAAWKTTDTRSASSCRSAADIPRFVAETSPAIATNLRLSVAPSICVLSLPNNWKQKSCLELKNCNAGLPHKWPELWPQWLLLRSKIFCDLLYYVL